MPIKSYYDILITETHLDTFEHMNNATYLKIFEEARWDLLTKNGYGLTEIQKNKQGPIVIEINIKFKKEIKNREAIKIETYCTEYVGKVGKLVQRMINQKGEECCLFEMTFGLFDLKTRKLIEPTPEWRKAIGI